MQDIISINSTKTAKPFLNILFNKKNIANFYAIGSSFFLTCQYSEEHKNSSITNNTSQLVNDLVPGQK